MEKDIKFIDLFAGIGGFHLALDKFVKEKKIKDKCVFVSEIDNQAIDTYTKNFKVKRNEIINIRDIDDKCSEVPDHDILFGGFPCQTFSNAGNKKGFLDKTRGTLFFEIAKILSNKKPKYFLLENVKHLTKHDHGKTWKVICETLEEIGYVIPEEPLILSPEQFGIPQDRQRVFIPGVRKDLTKDKYLKFDFTKYESNVLKDKNLNKTVKYIQKNFLEQNVNERFFLKNQKDGKYIVNVLNAWGEFVKNVKAPEGRTLPVIWIDELDKKYALEDMPAWRKKYLLDMRTVYSENKKYIDSWKKKYNVDKWKTREKKLEWQAGSDISDITETFIQLRQSGIRCKRPTKFPTLVAMVQVPIIFDVQAKEWRYLTPRENANLQSFPKNFKTYDQVADGNKDFFAYKQFGNSVNVYVVYLVIKELLERYGEF